MASFPYVHISCDRLRVILTLLLIVHRKSGIWHIMIAILIYKTVYLKSIDHKVPLL